MEKFPGQQELPQKSKGTEEAPESRIHPAVVGAYVDLEKAIAKEEEATKIGKMMDAAFYKGERERLQSYLAEQPPFAPPIKKGEVFDPEEELKDLRKYPPSLTELGADELDAYKEKLAFQRQGFGKMQEMMLDYIRKNPNASKNELVEEARFMAERFGFSAAQMQKIEAVLDVYRERRKLIREVREEHPDDGELYAFVTGRRPRGEVKAVAGPATINFRCFDPYDYAWIYNQKAPPLAGEIEPELTKAELEKAEATWGANPPGGFMIPSLAGAITIENSSRIKLSAMDTSRRFWENKFKKPIKEFTLEDSRAYVATANMEERRDSRTTFDHEEQHAIKKIFAHALGRPVPKETEDAVGYARKDIVEKFRALLRDRRRVYAEENIKDEILAYMKNSTAPKEVMQHLMKGKGEGGVYDYLADYRDAYFKGLSRRYEWGELDAETRDTLTEELYDAFFEEYHELIEKGLAAYKMLADEGYAHDQITGILIEEPLPKWPKVVERLLGKKKKDTTPEAPVPPQGR